MIEYDLKFLSIKELASKLNVHHSTIRRAIKTGKIKAITFGNGKRPIYRIPESEIEKIICYI